METPGYRNNTSHFIKDVDLHPLNEPRTILVFLFVLFMTSEKI